MSPKALASKILNFRNSVSLMMPSQLAAEIGPIGLQDAMQRGWLHPDMDQGYLRLTENIGLLQEMQALAETKCKNCEKDECPGCDAAPVPAQESAAHAPAMLHATRRMHETYGLGTASSGGGAPGSGQPARPATPAPNPAPAQLASNPAQQDYAVGDDVVIAEEGKTYQAKVGQRNPDGTYVLSFGPNRPANSTSAFKRERMQRVEGAKPGVPATP